MATRRLILTWNQAQKQWRKKYNNQLYYLGSGKNKSDRAGYNNAVKCWKVKKAEIDAGETLTTKPKDLKPPPVQTTPRWNPHRVSSSIKRFLQAKQIEVDTGIIKPSRLSDLRSCLQGFRDFFGSELMPKIDEKAITSYHADSSGKMAEGAMKVSTLGQNYKAVRQFYNWCYKQRIIKDRPRNLDDLSVTIPDQQNEYFTGKELNALVDACGDSESFSILKASIMLGINMGHGQQDVSDLLVGEVKHRNRPPRIIRKRSKTGIQSNHLMWRKTRELLIPFCKGKKANERVFSRPDGRPLVPMSVGKDGKLTGGRSDFLGTKFRRLVQDVLGKDDKRRFRELRKTGANRCKQRMLGTEPMYLAHKDPSMASIYTDPAQKNFDLMMTYMEKDFGFCDSLMKLKK